MPEPANADVPVRPASTVMLVRDTSAGPEVFMLRRTTKAVFAGGMYVFPGGKVDAGDGEGDDAFLVAAIRECYEEAGVLLAETADGQLISDGHPALGHREEVHGGSMDVWNLCREHSLRLATDRMAYVARWITPKGESPRRFDTRFYLAVSPPSQRSVHDDSETIASEWIRPGDALHRQIAGQMVMLPPTITTLTFLADFATADAALVAGRAIGTPPTILPKLRVDSARAFGGLAGVNSSGSFAGVSLPGDDDYDLLD